MSTRGSFGTMSNGTLKLTYNHSDSYPEGLGVDLAKQLVKLMEKHDQTSLKTLADLITLVDDESKPNEEQIKKLSKWTDLNVGDQSNKDWYCVLRDTQGKLDVILEEVGFMNEGNDFPKDSLFCEWAYVANFDDMTLEVYKGFQTFKHNKGRFADPFCTTEYKPVKLVKTFKLDKDLVSNMTKFCKSKVVKG